MLYIQPSRLICSCYVADQTYICLLRVVKCCIQNINIFFKEHKNIVLKESMIIAIALEELLWRMRGSAAWVFMVAVFVCGLCGSSDAVMAPVLRHQQRSHVARGGHHTGPHHRPARGSVGRMCKGSGIKYVVHTLPSGLQRGRTVVSWAVAPVTAPSVPACGTTS